VLEDRLFPALQNWQKHQNENGNNLSIRTPFSMILGSLEPQQQALQLYEEKHHSPIKKDKTNDERFDLSSKTNR
jgi:hypothetical protein